MDASKAQKTHRTFRTIALLGGLLLAIGLILRLAGLLITATYAMTLAGGVILLIGVIGLVTLQLAKPK